MKRRALLKAMLATGATAGFRLPLAHAADYRGKFLVCVQADGGWDPTSFCDPKTNVPGERTINHWARAREIQQAGNLAYAPFAANAAFFNRHHRRMLVINGVDAQTNSHTVGVVHNWSGRASEGYPTVTALLAAQHGTGMAVPYLSFGGYAETGSIVRFARLANASLLREIATPAAPPSADEPFFDAEDWATLQRYNAARADRLAKAAGRMPAEQRARKFYRSAFATEGLRAFADALPPEDALEPNTSHAGVQTTYYSSLRRQAQLAVLAFKTGAAVSADLWQWGFDTHDHHDADHAWLLANLTNAVDYLWDYAEQHGVADRLVVVIGSDFGRTNHYNAAGGKDHWPIGSVVVMQNGQRWTNRALGATDALHHAHKVNPATLARDDARGVYVRPAHVHKALRRHLGVAETPAAQRFPLRNVEDLPLFVRPDLRPEGTPS